MSTFPRPAIRTLRAYDVAPSTLEAVCDAPVTIASTAGLALVGTARTIVSATAIGSTVLIGLSGALASGIAVELEIAASNTIADLDGNRMQPCSVDVDNQVQSGSPPAGGPQFSAIINLTRDAMQTFDGEGPVALMLGPGPHVPGVVVTSYFPAGGATRPFTVDERVHLVGDGELPNDGSCEVRDFNSANAHSVTMRCLSASPLVVEATLRELPTIAAVAPAVTGVEVSGEELSHLVATFDRPVWFPSLDGVALTGAGRTIASILEGNGTREVTFLLSGDLTGAETGVTFDVTTPRTARALSSLSLLATGSTAVDIHAPELADVLEDATEVWERGKGQSATAWTGRKLGLALAQASTGHPTLGAGGWTFDPAGGFADGTLREHVASALTTNGNFKIYVRARNLAITPGGEGWIPVCFDTNGSTDAHFAIVLRDVNAGYDANDGATFDQQVDGPVASTLAMRDVFVDVIAGVATIRVHGRSPASHAMTKDVTAANNITVGCLVVGGPSTYYCNRGELDSFSFERDAVAAWTTDQMDAVVAYMNGRP